MPELDPRRSLTNTVTDAARKYARLAAGRPRPSVVRRIAVLLVVWTVSPPPVVGQPPNVRGLPVRPRVDLAAPAQYGRVVALSPDGRTLAWAARDARPDIFLYDLTDHEDRATLEAKGRDGASVTALTFSPDSKGLVEIMKDGTVCLWDAATGKEQTVLKVDDGDASRAVGFGPDGPLMAAIDIHSSDDTVRVWNLKTGKEQASLKGVRGERVALAFGPDASTLVTAGVESYRVWDVSTGRAGPVRKGTALWLQKFGPEMALSADRSTLLVTDAKRQAIRVCDLKTGTERAKVLAGGDVLPIAMSHDGGALVTVSLPSVGRDDARPGPAEVVELWDTRTGKRRATLPQLPTFSPDGRTFAVVQSVPSGGFPQWQINLWDARELRFWLTVDNEADPSPAMIFSADGRFLVVTGGRGIKVWDVPVKQESAVLAGHTGPVRAIAFAPDGKTIASAGDDKTVRLWDVSTRKVTATLAGHTGPVTSLVFGPDGKVLISGGADRTIRLWDPATGKETSRLAVPEPVVNLTLSPDGAVLAAAATDRRVRHWEVRTGKELASYEGQFVAYSPDGRTLAWATGPAHGIQLWDIATARERRWLGGYAPLVFAPDGKTLASGGRSAIVWDLTEGKEKVLAYLDRTAGSPEATCLAYGPDGKTVAIGHPDHVVTLWDLERKPRFERETLRGHYDRVTAVAISPDGRTLASASADHEVRLWNIAPKR